jgi:hypothetical protein
MVIRPEGAADLREYLRGARIPSDVYLLRKMHLKDPNSGPVSRVSEQEPTPPPAMVPDRLSIQPVAFVSPALPVPSSPEGFALSASTDTDSTSRVDSEEPSRSRAWAAGYSLIRFDGPLPPATHTVEEAPVLLAWMLEQDPMVAGLTDVLAAAHARTFGDDPVAQVGYQRHLLLLIGDDLLLHPNQEALAGHLEVLAAAYRRAVGASHAAVKRGQKVDYPALWRVASLACRLRLEAWVYRSRHGVSPEPTRRLWPRPGKPSPVGSTLPRMSRPNGNGSGSNGGPTA